MKLVMYGDAYRERPGVIVEDKYVLDLEREALGEPHSLEEILEFGLLPQIEEILEEEIAQWELIPLETVRLGPPLSGMGKIIAVGLNYRAHAAEMHDAVPANPLLFAKGANSLAGPYDELQLPPAAWSAEIDYEVELGVVIGHECRAVSPEDALAYVGGYTIVNDVTARDVQRAESQWFRAKSYDGFCPVGPWLVTPDELDDPQELALTLKVNGEVRQQSNTSDMIHGIAELISFISQGITLNPGDIISTGTPSGIGAGMTPPTYLKAGDRLELEIEGLGRQEYGVIV